MVSSGEHMPGALWGLGTLMKLAARLVADRCECQQFWKCGEQSPDGVSLAGMQYAPYVCANADSTDVCVDGSEGFFETWMRVTTCTVCGVASSQMTSQFVIDVDSVSELTGW